MSLLSRFWEALKQALLDILNLFIRLWEWFKNILTDLFDRIWNFVYDCLVSIYEWLLAQIDSVIGLVLDGFETVFDIDDISLKTLISRVHRYNTSIDLDSALGYVGAYIDIQFAVGIFIAYITIYVVVVVVKWVLRVIPGLGG